MNNKEIKKTVINLVKISIDKENEEAYTNKVVSNRGDAHTAETLK